MPELNPYQELIDPRDNVLHPSEEEFYVHIVFTRTGSEENHDEYILVSALNLQEAYDRAEELLHEDYNDIDEIIDISSHSMFD